MTGYDDAYIDALAAKPAEIEKIDMAKYGDRVDTSKNLEMLQKAGTNVHVLSILPNVEQDEFGVGVFKPGGRIYEIDMRPGVDPTRSEIEQSFLIDIDKFWEAKKLAKMGKKEESEKIVFASQYFQDLLKEAGKQKAKVDSTFQPYSRTLGSASLGNIINTAYEVVRRINYLTVVTSPYYNMANFNAKNVTNVIGVTNLNLKGFYKNALPQGIPEIGDNVTPDITTLQYTAFTKSIFADSFRYEFTMRDISDSAFSLEAQVQADIPGVFAKMETQKITNLINALTPDVTISTKWNTISGNFYSADAASDVEAGEVSLDNYGSGDSIILPRDTMRFYLKNIQSAINTLAPPSLQKPDSVRTGIMPRNPNLTYFVNNFLTSKTFFVVSKFHFLDFYQGPKVNVSYKNQFTPGQVEGRIMFSFNGIIQKIRAAGYFGQSVA